MRVKCQAEMESFLRDFLKDMNTNQSDRMCGLIKPSLVSCSFEEQTVVMSYPAQYWEQNPLGIMQGGVVATVLDFTVGCLNISLTHDMPMTVSMQVSYLRPSPASGNMIVRARATKLGRTLTHGFAEAWAEAEPDKLVATANCVYTA